MLRSVSNFYMFNFGETYFSLVAVDKNWMIFPIHHDFDDAPNGFHICIDIRILVGNDMNLMMCNAVKFHPRFGCLGDLFWDEGANDCQ